MALSSPYRLMFYVCMPFKLSHRVQGSLQVVVQETLLDFMLQISLHYQLVKTYISCCVHVSETWLLLNWEMTFILGKMLSETIVFSYFIRP
jgi:hypothetical protein